MHPSTRHFDPWCANSLVRVCPACVHLCCLRCRGGDWSIQTVSDDSNDELGGWQCQACVGDAVCEREEESIRVEVKGRAK